jgi:hypothetical protein
MYTQTFGYTYTHMQLRMTSRLNAPACCHDTVAVVAAGTIGTARLIILSMLLLLLLLCHYCNTCFVCYNYTASSL